MIREICNDSVLASDTERWRGTAANKLMKYEEHLYEFFKRGVTDRGEKVWTFWNAVFYCGTIYTTIGESTYFLFYSFLFNYLLATRQFQLFALSD